MKLYKDDRIMQSVDKDQLQDCLDAGWSRKDPKIAEAEAKAKADAEEAELQAAIEAEEIEKAEAEAKAAEAKAAEVAEVKDSTAPVKIAKIKPKTSK